MPALSTRLLNRAAQDNRIINGRQATEAVASDVSQLAKRAATKILRPRQNALRINGAIPTWYRGYGVSPGAVVGIVLGSIAGFLLIIWLFMIVSQGGAFIRTSTLREEDDITTRSHHHHKSTRSKRSRRTEMRSRSPRRERIVRQERIVRDRSVPVGGSIQPPRAPSRIYETIVVEEPERRVEGDDIVEVIEEHSSIGGPPRRKSRRGSTYRRDDFSDLSSRQY
ncbi:hypothetical protein K431DRAFT_135709 [Polychaeton citri CBS 116435]|uniref:Uncharacterized protein n=1 Tax=Polychaeton citri CBS 116435 TaxID=1314669 RepID=A0A9P4Q517_9PEZI|nr:hypothetical protein K431DRAFT_135709 [Polychaeton citri CBS 116435]